MLDHEQAQVLARKLALLDKVKPVLPLSLREYLLVRNCDETQIAEAVDAYIAKGQWQAPTGEWWGTASSAAEVRPAERRAPPAERSTGSSGAPSA